MTAPDLDVHLTRIADGDTHAYGAFLASAEPVVRQSLRSFAIKVDVEAVLQESFLRSWQVAPKLVSDGKPNGLLRLTLRIARNLALDEVKRRREDALPEGAEPGYEPAPPDPFLNERIRACFGKIPGQPRVALSARIESGPGDTDAAIAERLGMRVNTFFQNVARARKLMLECLGKAGVVLEAIGVEVVR
jgi:RNA polymerase sigma-70 factor (ECF subfamily)